MQVFSYTKEELREIITDAVTELLKGVKPEAGNQYDFVSDKTARCILSGCDKPISTVTFNKLRKEKKVNTYRSTEGRTIYSREELISYIKSTRE